MQIPFAVDSGKLVHSWQRWRALSHPLMLMLNPALKTSQSVQHTSCSSTSAADTSGEHHCTRHLLTSRAHSGFAACRGGWEEALHDSRRPSQHLSVQHHLAG